MNSVILNAASGSEMQLIIELAKRLNIEVLPLSKAEREEIEDLKLLSIMREAKDDGLADRQQTLTKLGL